MTTKTNKNTINLNDFGKWENQLPLYLDLYSKLTDEGKKEMKNQVSTLDVNHLAIKPDYHLI